MTPPREHHMIVQRTARYYTLGRDDGEASEVWFVLHGQGYLAGTFIEAFRSLDDGDRLIVAPEGLSRFYRNPLSKSVGASWMTAEDRLNEIRDYVEYIDTLVTHILDRSTADTLRVILLGFSQGGAAAARSATYGSRRPDHLIIWGSDVPPDLKMDVLKERIDQGMRLSMVVGRSDEYFTSAIVQSQQQMLERERVPHRWIEFDGGHVIETETVLSLALDRN